MTTLTKSRIHGTDVVTAEGTIVGTVNGGSLRVTFATTAELKTGLIRGNYYFEECPPSFNALAISGLSLISYKNSATPVKAANALTLLDLSGGNYDIRRKNIFPDGNFVELYFQVRAETNSKLRVAAEWNGTCPIPPDISTVRMPITETLYPDKEGVVRGYYEYTVVTQGGECFTVKTPSEYLFEPVGELLTLPCLQKRTTVANWLWKDERTLELISCSSMITLHE